MSEVYVAHLITGEINLFKARFLFDTIQNLNKKLNALYEWVTLANIILLLLLLCHQIESMPCHDVKKEKFKLRFTKQVLSLSLLHFINKQYALIKSYAL